jgi:hypothetical protein
LETAYSIALGISLSAACGFRVFVPFLVMSIAALAGTLPLSDGFAWVGTVPALVVFASATLVEVAAYYIPWVDNLLDTIATPLALVAGTVASASVLTDVSPVLQWTLAILAGGGSAGLIQAVLVPVLALLLVATLAFFMTRAVLRFRSSRRRA